MSRAHRRFCATLVYALAAILTWLAVQGAGERRPVARVERAPASQGSTSKGGESLEAFGDAELRSRTRSCVEA